MEPERGHVDGIRIAVDNDNLVDQDAVADEDDLLRPGNIRNGFRQWTVEDVLIDETLRTGYQQQPRVVWSRADNRDIQREPLEYFYRFFPMHYIDTILRHTNAEVDKRRAGPAQNDRAISDVQSFEFLRWIGIRLAVSLERPRGSLQDLFSNNQEEETIFRASSYGERFKMSFTRFRQINSCLRFAEDLPPGRNRVSTIYPLIIFDHPLIAIGELNRTLGMKSEDFLMLSIIVWQKCLHQEDI